MTPRPIAAALYGSFWISQFSVLSRQLSSKHAGSIAPRAQYRSLSAKRMRRSVADAEVTAVKPPVVRTVPSAFLVADAAVAPGFPKAGVFVRLNISQRNWIVARSLKRKERNRLPSRFL